ncbi:MAG: ATP-grasp domain-containing protein [Muribaculum sp.]|nr:ATP-grasp domain-containing protein [Muribaculum sp.]
MKRIMILAGGPDQAALIKEIKLKFPDSYTVLVDMNPDVVAAKVADKQVVVSTMDFDKVKEAAVQENVDYIMTACGDQPLLTVGIVSEELGLPCYLTKRQILNLTNKKFMKNLMVKNNIPTSKHKTFDSLDDIDDSGLEYPLIVKPVDSNGSKGVRRVNNKEELIEQSPISMGYSISKSIIVEEFVEGEDVSSDFYVINGEAIHVMDCLSNKFKPNPETAIIYQSIIPPSISEEVKDEIQRIAQTIARVFGIDNSPLLIQTIVKGNNVKVVEFSARLGGGAKYKTIQTVTGFNVLKANLDSMLGELPYVHVMDRHLKFSRCHLYTSGGVLDRIEGLDSLLENGLIEDYFINKKAGAKLETPKSSGDRVASILFSAPDFETLGEKISKAINTVKVIDNIGRDILMRDMYSNPIKNAFGF